MEAAMEVARRPRSSVSLACHASARTRTRTRSVVTDDGANDLLDTIVQDHLQRAIAPAPAPAGPADPAAPDRSDLLQKEIAALLSDDPPAQTAPPAPPAPAAHEPPPDSAPEIFPRSITSRAGWLR